LKLIEANSVITDINAATTPFRSLKTHCRANPGFIKRQNLSKPWAQY